MTPVNLLSEWARLLLASLEAAGVRDVVISPGSRSTPFAWAALEHDGLRCHSVLDERSAGFFALGQARESGRPSVLVCTSGSAGAHYLPAVIEAGESGLPLLVLTADRPFELQECAAPQTIDQARLFGAHARAFFELGLPDPEPAALRGLQRRAALAVHTTLTPDPGPVHLNARARKPLEPCEPDDDRGRALRDRVDALIERGPTAAAAPRRLADPDAIERVAARCRAARRGLIVCGPSLPRDTDATAAAALAQATGFPLLAEATSQLRFGELEPAPAGPVCGAFDLLLEAGAFSGDAAPDLLLQLGAPPTSGALWRYLEARPLIERHVLASRAWPDPISSAASLVVAPLADSLRALTAAVGSAPPGASERAAWRDRIARAEATAQRLIADELDASDATAVLSEPAAVRATVVALPRGSQLVLGNSMPVREVDDYAPPAARGLQVGFQRGANGIDGLIAGAAGAASCSGRPSALLLGDLAFLHDLGGLWPARELETPFVVVVLDNGGGRIFERLPLARSGVPQEALRYWVTPHRLDLAAAARLYGLHCDTPASADELEAAVASALERPGPSLVLARVAPHSAAETRVRLCARLADALGAASEGA